MPENTTKITNKYYKKKMEPKFLVYFMQIFPILNLNIPPITLIILNIYHTKR